MKTAIIYSHNAVKTSQVAKKILEFGKLKDVDDINVEELNPETLKKYDLLILGAPTWFDGELPDYWDELIPSIEEVDLNGKKVAIFGNGDQVGYPENFGDAVGLLADIIESRGANIIGLTKTDGYNFEKSLAIKGDMFAGLILDFENQHSENNKRIKDWVKSLI